MKRLMIGCAALVLLLAVQAEAASFLFDCTKIEVAGNADWVIDADSWNKSGRSDPQRFPTPDQDLVGPGTLETFWTGSYSSYGIALVKAGHHVETLPRLGEISYGNGSNPQDLSNYDVYVLPEPQVRFYTEEKADILQFVADGGALLLIADHCGADRNNNGWDAARVLNDLGSPGEFGIRFAEEADDDCYNDQLCFQFNPDPADPFIRGPFGTPNRIGFNATTRLIIDPAVNPNVTAHAWHNAFPGENDNVMLASCFYGSGRVAAIGDSSPAEDETGDTRDELYPGWDQVGADNDVVFLNMSHWLASGGTVPATPTPTVGPSPTPTATPDTPWIHLSTSRPLFHPGEEFVLYLTLRNLGSTRTVDVFVALEVQGQYWFWDDWGQSVDFQRRVLIHGYDDTEELLRFSWPSGAGSMSGLSFWGVITAEGTYDLLGNVAQATFGFQEP